MLFSSPVFFGFFAVYFAFHCLVSRRYSVYFIILGSTVFYAWWKVEYVWLPYLLTIIAYLGVRLFGGVPEHSKRRRRMLFTVALLFVPHLQIHGFHLRRCSRSSVRLS
jgi:alginate O-acetyltransferase complex protein AlgI